MTRYSRKDISQREASSSKDGLAVDSASKRARDTTRTPIVILDHTGSPGGGQLGILRFLIATSEKDDYRLVLLQDGVIASEAQAHGVAVDVICPAGRRWTRGGMTIRFLIYMRRINSRTIVANSLRTVQLLAFLPRRGRTKLGYIREDVSRASMSRVKYLYFSRLILPRMDGLIVNSESTRQGLGKNLHRIPTRRAYPVSGIEVPATIAPAPSTQDTLRILSLSRLERWKGVDILLRAMHSLAIERPDIRLSATIAGTGDSQYASELREYARKHDLRVEFVGHIESDAIPWSRHDALILCSKSPEAFGQVLPQAMSRGVPVIAPRAGGPAEILTHGNDGLMFEPGSDRDLAQKIIELSASPALHATIAQNAFSTVSRYADTHTVRSLDEAIRSLSNPRT